MWTEKRKNGVLFVERYKHPMTEKYFRVSVLMEKDTPKNRKLANEILIRKRDDEIGSISAAQKELTLSDLVELYRIDQKRTVKPSTYKRNYHACNSLMSILGKDTLVNNLTAGYVKERFSSRSESNGTINERITRMKALMRWGYSNDYINDISWLDKISLLPNRAKKEKVEDKYFEREELNMLLDAMKVNHWRLLTEFCALSGLRIGEALALKVDDIDLAKKMIYVSESYDYINDITGTPKTVSSVRGVSMQGQLYTLVKRIFAVYRRSDFRMGISSPLLFHDENGENLDYYAYNKYLRETSEEILGKYATTHILRHTHCALLAENGVPLDVISRRLGHQSNRVTRDVYFHVTNKLKERDAALLANIEII